MERLYVNVKQIHCFRLHKHIYVFIFVFVGQSVFRPNTRCSTTSLKEIETRKITQFAWRTSFEEGQKTADNTWALQKTWARNSTACTEFYLSNCKHLIFERKKLAAAARQNKTKNILPNTVRIQYSEGLQRKLCAFRCRHKHILQRLPGVGVR